MARPGAGKRVDGVRCGGYEFLDSVLLHVSGRELLTGPRLRACAALRLQRSFRQASDALAFRALERADAKEGRGEAKTFGSSILRAYAEEQRLVQENASVRAQLDALRKQVDEESDWRRNARALQGTLAEREQELAAINDKHAAETAALTAELTGVKADLASANAAEAALSDEARQLRMELEVSRVRLAAQERRAAEAEQRLHGLQVAGESEAHYKGRITLLEKELDVVSTQLQALSAATESKDAYIASLCQDARAAMTQSKVLARRNACASTRTRARQYPSFAWSCAATVRRRC